MISLVLSFCFWFFFPLSGFELLCSSFPLLFAWRLAFSSFFRMSSNTAHLIPKPNLLDDGITQ